MHLGASTVCESRLRSYLAASCLRHHLYFSPSRGPRGKYQKRKHKAFHYLDHATGNCPLPLFAPRVFATLPLVLFCVAALSLPYLAYNTGNVERAHVERDLGLGGGLASVNGLGEWFGFFAIYFAICGLETNRFSHRLAAWGTVVGCLLVVGLTVSRGSMFGAALGIVIAFRSLLKRGFIPVLLLLTIAGIIYESGLFDQAVTGYEERAMQESGRERIWPAVMNRIMDNPVFGVGESKVATQVSAARFDQPHNTFLYISPCRRSHSCCVSDCVLYSGGPEMCHAEEHARGRFLSSSVSCLYLRSADARRFGIYGSLGTPDGCDRSRMHGRIWTTTSIRSSHRQ